MYDKKIGDAVNEGDLIALSKGLFGLFKSEAKAWSKGTIELVSDTTGLVAIREQSFPLGIDAYIPGKVTETIPTLGAIIETSAAVVQGIFGIGGETQGDLMVIAGPTDVLSEENLSNDCRGKILIGGAIADLKYLKKAESLGAVGVVTGGIDRETLSAFTNSELGVAITGTENIQTKVIITEGFGKMSMSKEAYNLLKSLNGLRASMNGTTQIRAGVIRPEIIVPIKETFEKPSKNQTAEGMTTGTLIRLIRRPYFGSIGRIEILPPELQRLQSESKARVAVIRLDDGSSVTVPRANLEIMEE